MENYTKEQIKKVIAQFDEGYTPADRKPNGNDFSKKELWDMLAEISVEYNAEELMVAYSEGF